MLIVRLQGHGSRTAPHEEIRLPRSNTPQIVPRTEYSFYDEEGEDRSTEDSDEDYDHRENEEVVEEEDLGSQRLLDQEEEPVADYMHCETEAEKRQERRRAKVAREREGERRRREGLPRNYLLVDEHTKKPYGAGVGNWRKELMLLSKKLDPAIGQINKQPPNIVKEIAH